MQLTPTRPRVLDRSGLLAASLALLAQAGCLLSSIPSERHGNLPPASRPSEVGCAICGVEASGGCLHRPHGAEPELPWPRFHPLPTQPLVSPGDPGWP